MYSLYFASNDMTAFQFRSRCFAQAALVEGACWLSLGVLVRYFEPEADSRLVERMNINLAGLEQFLADWGYLFDTEWLAYLRAIGGVRKMPELPRQADMEQARDAYEACLLRARHLSTPSAGAATATFDFDSAGDIESYLVARDVSIENISEAMASQAGIGEKSGEVSIGSLYAGFGEMISFLDGFLEARNYFGADDAAEALFRKVAQLLRWRLHFIENKSDLYHQFVNRYLDILGIEDYELRARCRSHLDSLAAEWRGMQGPALAVASASN